MISAGASIRYGTIFLNIIFFFMFMFIRIP